MLQFRQVRRLVSAGTTAAAGEGRASAFVKSCVRALYLWHKGSQWGTHGVHTYRRTHAMNAQAPRFTDRETARAKLTAKIADQRRQLADPRGFATIDPRYLIADAEFRLRWIDCAPEGANHNLAPMQDKRGVPMGACLNENVGPCKSLREARAARGLHPVYPIVTA